MMSLRFGRVLAAVVVAALSGCSDENPSRPGPSDPDPSIDYREFLGWRASIDGPANLRLLTGFAPRAFVSWRDLSGVAYLQIVDLTDPIVPRFAGKFSLPGSVVALQLFGDRVLVGTRFNLTWVDFSDWDAPVLLGSAALPATGTDVAIAGSLAWSVGEQGEVRLYDIFDRTRPNLRARYFGLVCRRVVAEDYHAYVVARDTRGGGASLIRRINISRTGALVPGATISSTAQDLELSDSLLYVLESDRLAIFATADRDSLPLIGEFPFDHSVSFMHLQNDIVSLGGAELLIVDVSDPTQPTLKTRLRRRTSGALVARDRAILQDRSDRLTVIDRLHAPAVAPLGRSDDFGDCRDVSVEGGRAYLTDGQSDLVVINPHDPTDLVALGRMRAASTVLSMDQRGTLVFLAEGLHGVEIVGATDPLHLIAVGTIPDRTWGVKLDGSLAFLACGPDGLKIFDVSDVTAPVLLGWVAVTGLAWDVVIRDSIAFVACLTGGLSIVDVKDPTAPRLLATLEIPGSVMRVSVAEGTVCLTCSDGWYLVDARIPEQPRIAARIGPQNDSSHAILDGTVAYLADREFGIKVVDVSDPWAPNVLGSAESRGQAQGLAASGGRVYLADGTNGLVVFPAQR